MANRTIEDGVIHGKDEHVDVTDDGGEVKLSWSDTSGQNRGSDIEMARFTNDGQLLRIFPRRNESGKFVDQFSKVREIQIAAPNSPLDEESLLGDNGERPELELYGLPKGFSRYFAFGLGLQPKYRGIINEIEDQTNCTVVRFIYNQTESEGEHDAIFNLSLSRFESYVAQVERHRRRATGVVLRINNAVAHNEIATITGETHQEPTLGRIKPIQDMTRAIYEDAPLDVDQQSELMATVGSRSKQIAKEQPESFGKLREDLELVTLDVLIERFAEKLSGKGPTDEAAWQKFFVQNIFVLKQLFAAPLVLHKEQVDLRITDDSGGGRRIADFVLANTLTRSMVVVEIKTPAMQLINKEDYRGKYGADVYPPHKHLSGSIVQLQAQMESSRTDFPIKLNANLGAKPLDTKFVRGAIIAGKLSDFDLPLKGLSPAQQKLRMESFERYRNGLNGIEIITYDEVLERLRALRAMLMGGDEV